MVRESSRRKQKYEAKVDPDVLRRQTTALKPLMVKGETEYFTQITDLEERIKKLVEAKGVKTLEVKDYLNYGRELYSLSKRFSGETLKAEAQLKAEKWSERGLEGTTLEEVAGLCGISLIVETKWWDAFPYMFNFREGNRYFSNYLTYYTPISNTVTLQGKIYAMPFLAPRRLRLDQIGVRVYSTSGSPEVWFGAYKDNGQLYPSDLIKDLGRKVITTSDMQAVDIDLIVEKGLFWLSFYRIYEGTLYIYWTPYYHPLLGTPVGFNIGCIGYMVDAPEDKLPSTFPEGASLITQLLSIFVRIKEVL